MDIYPGKTDRLVFETKSAVQEIKVFDKLNGLRYLLLNGVQHGGRIPGSPGRLVLPYFRLSTTALLFLDDPRDYLFIGLGMGALPAFFRVIQPDCRMDVVEIDPAVVQAAKDWFGFREDAGLRVIAGDGREYVRATSRRYDAVFLDAYQDLGVPEHLTTAEFLREVRAVLKPGGVVVSNLWGSAVNKLFYPCVRTLLDSFEELYQFKSYTYNYIFVCDTKPRMQPHELLARAKVAMRRFDLDIDLVGVVRAHKHIPKDDVDAEPLTDPARRRA